MIIPIPCDIAVAYTNLIGACGIFIGIVIGLTVGILSMASPARPHVNKIIRRRDPWEQENDER